VESVRTTRPLRSGRFQKAATYTALGKQCVQLEKQWGAKPHRIFYMATPSSMFGEIPKETLNKDRLKNFRLL
jgi:glucose-6-phosphate 1-dehydrogenase